MREERRVDPAFYSNLERAAHLNLAEHRRRLPGQTGKTLMGGPERVPCFAPNSIIHFINFSFLCKRRRGKRGRALMTGALAHSLARSPEAGMNMFRGRLHLALCRPRRAGKLSRGGRGLRAQRKKTIPPRFEESPEPLPSAVVLPKLGEKSHETHPLLQQGDVI